MALRLLAFDTSTQLLSVAVHDGARTLAVNESGGAQASARQLPLVHELLAQACLAFRDLDGIAFGRGPGAFTGLRTSCSVAQGLAFGADKPVLPLDSLMLVAEDARASCGGAGGPIEIAVAMDARIGQIYAARYRFAAAGWHELQAPGLFDLADLLELWRVAAPRIVAGSAWAAFGDRLRLPPCERLAVESDRAGALMRLALQRWRPENVVPAAMALPLYLRDKVALTTHERDAARAAKAAA